MKNDNAVFGRVARKRNPAERVRVNKAGTISVLSIVRALELPDDIIFDVRLNRRQKTITLVPMGVTIRNGAEPLETDSPQTPPPDNS